MICDLKIVFIFHCLKQINSIKMEIGIKLKFNNSVISTEWTKLIIKWDHPGPDLIATEGIGV